MAQRDNISRRQFLASSTKTAAAISVGSAFVSGAMIGCSESKVPVDQGRMAPVRKIGANDRIRFGLIGSGGRGTGDACEASVAPNTECVALCDLADFRLNEAHQRVSKVMAGQDKKVDIKFYKDYHQLLDRKDIDAVIIATPDHWHCQPFLDAIAAGKHVYQEKPMSYTIEQGMQMWEAARKRPELTVQIGTQRRSSEHYQDARQLIKEGVIGDVMYARAYDCRNFVTARDPFAPRDVEGAIDWDKFQEPCKHKVAYDEWRYFAWRWYWDYAGGLVTDVGVHVMDIVHLLAGIDTPKSVVCNGGVYGLDYWETPDVVNAVWDYGTMSVSFVSNFTNGWAGDGLTIFGTKGTVEVRGSTIYVWDESQRGNRGMGEKPLHTWEKRGPKHQHNWLDCIRTGKTPNAPIELGFKSLLPSHMANLAYRSGKKIVWDAKAQKVV